MRVSDGPPQAREVRPYTLTGGRTRAAEHVDLPLEALVRSTAAIVPPGVMLEHRRIIELCADRLLSVAELSVRLRVPVGVTRVLVSEVAGAGLVTLHHSELTAATPTVQRMILERALSGLSRL